MNTEDLTSYIPGYEEYLEENENSSNEPDNYDNSDDLYESMISKKEEEKMERNIISLVTTKLTLDEIFNLTGYVWKNNLLIPEELLKNE